jgi:hypothetical protein
VSPSGPVRRRVWSVDDKGILEELTALHLDLDCNNAYVRRHVREVRIRRMAAPTARTRGPSICGQLRNADGKVTHRQAGLASSLAIFVLAKLLNCGYLADA